MKMQLIAIAALAAACVLGCQRTTVQGQGGQKLTLIKPADVAIVQGGTATVTIRITRTNLTEGVSVDFGKLPKGVKVTDAGRKITGDEASFTLQADKDADLVADHHAQVKVEGPGGISATETFEITVKAP